MKLIFTHITVGPDHMEDPFHVEAIKGPLTRNIGPRLSDVLDEIDVAFGDYIPPKDGAFSVTVRFVFWLTTRG